ncbi:DUF2523 domain-containing protein [Photobacterium leiognathi]|uniref:DUF2523 domain-containing protein n=1 Tax=Photobacterium leiognathi TaxID=553611 RepID=UPI002739CE3D|nr:DUF2523 domain-containing protein [Photobacterium leiognathi]
MVVYLFNSFFPALIGSTVANVATGIGMGTVLFVGFDFAIDSVISKINSNFAGIPADVITMIDLVGLPDALNIMLSGAFTLLVIKGLNNKGLRKQVWRKPGDKNDMNWEA